MLNAADLNLNGYNFTVQCTDPWIILIHDFLDEKEIESLLQSAKDRFRRSHVVGDENANTVHEQRTSFSCMFRKTENPVLSSIEDRVSKITGLSKQYMEPCQLVKYEKNQQYAPHFDWFDTRGSCAREEVNQRGQRFLTILAYLVEPSAGGNTVFPRIDLHVPATAGSALLWFNTNAGKADERTEHGGMPVYDGTKVAMNIWVRDKKYEDETTHINKDR